MPERDRPCRARPPTCAPQATVGRRMGWCRCRTKCDVTASRRRQRYRRARHATGPIGHQRSHEWRRAHVAEPEPDSPNRARTAGRPRSCQRILEGCRGSPRGADRRSRATTDIRPGSSRPPSTSRGRRASHVGRAASGPTGSTRDRLRCLSSHNRRGRRSTPSERTRRGASPRSWTEP